MNAEEIFQLLQEGERADLVFLPASSRNTRIGEALVALANGHGGRILLGVRGRQHGLVEGLPNPEQTRALLLKTARACTPPLELPPPEVVLVERKALLVVTVPAGRPCVYHWRGRYLHRQGRQILPLDPVELRSLLLERGEDAFETLPPPAASLEDLDLRLVSRYSAYLPESPDDPLDLLRQRGYLRETPNGLLPTTAALLCFGRNPQAFLPQARLLLFRYDGTDPDQLLEQEEATGTLPEQVRQAEAFLHAHMRRGRMWENEERVEVTEYPMDAVREAILNAVMHRDYSLRGDEVRVSLFANRIEVYSPGRLPGPVTEENLLEERFSRNPLIAQVFVDLGLTERSGYGLNRMVTLMEESHLPPPAFRETAGGFLLTLYGPQEMTVEGLPADPRALARLGLNERQVQALLYVDEHGQITGRDYQALCPEVSAETLRRDLVDLVSRGLLLKIGERRATYYILK